MKIALFLTSIYHMDLERISYEDGFREDML